MTQMTIDVGDRDGDVLNPGLSAPSDIYEVTRLDRKGRERRVEKLKEQALDIYRMGLDQLDGHTHVGTVIMFSGGNDSTVLAHLMRPYATHAFHANTGIGIEETRQFVRDTCAAWDLPLIEKHPPVPYRDLVLERGFPGPPMHFKMQNRLKQRCEEAAHRDLVKNGHRERVIFVGGRRRAESDARKSLLLTDRVGARIHVSPLVNWTKPDMVMYRLMHDVPLNSMSVLIGMSGECLCGAYAKPGELDMIRQHAPAAAQQIEDLQREVHAAGHPEPYCRWGHGKGAPSKKTGNMCSSCSLAQTDPLWDELDPYMKELRK